MAERIKILVTSLGANGLSTGKRLANGYFEPITEDNYSRALDYFNESGHFDYEIADSVWHSPFTSDALARQKKADVVLYIGTVKSQWELLYVKYTKQPTWDVYHQICEFKAKNNHTTKDFDEFSEVVKKPLKKCEQMPWHSYFRPIRYGVTSEEILYNYSVLKNELEDIFKQNEKAEYDVIFDLTGSLRSLPVYQMIFMNYFKNLKKYHVSIESMYYAMFETRKEFHDDEHQSLVKVVNLKDLMTLMEMVNGITEFNNTGSVITLRSAISQNDIFAREDAAEILKKFDHSTSLNNMVDQKELCIQLLNIRKELERKNTPGDDAFGTFIDSVWATFFKGNSEDNIDAVDCDYQFKRNVALWYFEQKRYGLAAITILEALRSLLVINYLKLSKMEVTAENLKDENNRRNSVSQFTRQANMFAKKNVRDEIKQLFCDVEASRKKVAAVRNEFAHNLDADDKVVDTDENIANIKKFFDLFEKLVTVWQKYDGKEFQKIYEEKEEKIVVQAVTRNSSKPLVIGIIDTKHNVEKDLQVYDSLKNPPSGERTVFFIPQILQEKLHGARKNDPKVCVRQGNWLGQYINSYFPGKEADEIVIIFCDLTWRQKVLYGGAIMRFLTEKGRKVKCEIYDKNGKKIEDMPFLDLSFNDKQVDVSADIPQDILKEEPIKL